ncbi:MAG: restriction endonuclease subunit S [Alphaproteobacteria bacterium]|nr:restriction endonuclease subunit S [Alphaproteobacteria bacterium]MBQ9235092.1 restriction endonuclease subunit S [Alphaproteobacteria bacterium]
MKLDDFCYINPTEKLERNQLYDFVEMADLIPGNRYVHAKTKEIFNGSYSKFTNKDVLMAKITPCLENGKISQYIGDNKAFGSTEFNIFRAKEGTSDPDFLYYLISSDYVKDIAVKSMTGACGRQRANTDEIKQIEVNNIHIDIQRKIAKILSNYDDLIDNNNKRIKILEDMAQKIYKEWFVDFKYPGHETATFKDTELGKIPSDWDVKTLNQCSKLFDNQRKPLSSLQRSNMKGVYPYYGAAKILDYINDYIFEGKYLLLAEDGSVITEEGYPVLQFVNGKFWANNHTHIIQGIKNISTEFLYLSLAKYSIIRCITGAAQPKINQENLNRIELIIPNDNILIRFNNLISPIFDEIFLIEQKQKILKQTRDLLLPRLMSSEIDIDKLEIV